MQVSPKQIEVTNLGEHQFAKVTNLIVLSGTHLMAKINIIAVVLYMH